jgi:hypothetical protein
VAKGCAFDLAHYGELLDAAQTGGYRFTFFNREPRPGDLLLRHDVDMSLAAAVTMAELEAERDVQATYFLMTRSDFYNLDSRSGVAALAKLRDLGHRVGLHGVYPDAALDDRFDAVIAWHTPDPDYMSSPIRGVVNVMQEPYFDPERYRSDSNQHWRSGCPHDELAAGSFEWLQLLVHPEIWVYDGKTMRETMASQLDAERELRWQQLAENRIDLT